MLVVFYHGSTRLITPWRRVSFRQIGVGTRVCMLDHYFLVLHLKPLAPLPEGEADYTPYEGPNLANQTSRRLRVFDRKPLPVFVILIDVRDY